MGSTAGGYNGGMGEMGGSMGGGMGGMANTGMQSQSYALNTGGMATPGGMILQPFEAPPAGEGMRPSNSRYNSGAMPSQYSSRTGGGNMGSSRFSSGRNSSSIYGSRSHKKKPSKKTMMATVLFIAAIAWVLFGE